MINRTITDGGKARKLALALLLLFIGTTGCCSAKNPEFLKKFEKRSRKAEAADPDVQALTLFSYAQQLALEGDNQGAIREIKKAVNLDPDSAYLKKVLAYLYYQEGQMDNALARIKESLEANQAPADSHQIMGLILYEMEKFDEAEPAFLKALEIEPDNSEHVINAVESMLRQDKPDRALSALGRFISEHPGDVDALYYMAAIFHSTGNLDEAALRYKKVLAGAPAYYPALDGMFRLEAARGNGREAVAAGRALLAFYPDDASSRMMLVDLLVRQGRIEESLEALDQGKRSGVLIPDWWLQKGYLLLGEDRALEARDEFETAVSLDPQSHEAVIALGMAEAALDNKVEAMSCFESVPKSSEFYPEARRQLALLAAREGEHERAVSIMEKIYRANPDNPAVLFSYVAILRDVEEYGRAQQLIEKALKDKPGDGDLIYELGMNYYLRGRNEDSIKTMQGLLEKSPDNAQVLNFIGYTWAEQGVRLDEAEAMIRKALDLEPGAGHIMDSLGWVYFQRGEYETAMKWIDKAIEASGPDPEILEHKADIYRAQKKINQAIKTYNQALEKAVSERIKKRILKKLEEMG